MSDRYRQAGGLRDFDLLAFWAMLVVLIFYPLSPEIIVFGDQVQSEPKLFDAFWAWIFPVFFLFFSLRDRNAASILGWVCFVLSIIVLFILQMQATAVAEAAGDGELRARREQPRTVGVAALDGVAHRDVEADLGRRRRAGAGETGAQ